MLKMRHVHPAAVARAKKKRDVEKIHGLPEEPPAKLFPFIVRYLTINGKSMNGKSVGYRSPHPFALSKVSKPVLSLSKGVSMDCCKRLRG